MAKGTPIKLAQEASAKAARAKRQTGNPLKAALEAQGFTVEEAGELGLRFQYEGGTYYLPPSGADTEFFHLLFPNFWELESDEEFGRALVACDAVNREAKLVKLHTAEGDVWAGVEALHDSPEAFITHLPRYLSYVQEAVRVFRDAMLAQGEEQVEEQADDSQEAQEHAETAR
ncbi:hypothetical protein Dcar01_00076 [Deinococcus carri]|uniref:Sensory transduction regulator n=1 Tax=Deinococcus carri TaxID=1211323 RepID=A0ABP9W1Y1_9DEIO